MIEIKNLSKKNKKGETGFEEKFKVSQYVMWYRLFYDYCHHKRNSTKKITATFLSCHKINDEKTSYIV